MESTLIKLQLTPDQMDVAMPDMKNGFADHLLVIPVGNGTQEITYNTSYDGELEFIATVKDCPPELTDQAEELLREYFSDDDDNIDEDEDEEEEE